jgi:hypothetical protein
MSVSRGESRASANGPNQTFEESRQSPKPHPSNARSRLKRNKALSKQGGTLAPSKARPLSMSLTREALPGHQGEGPLTIDGSGDIGGNQLLVGVELPAPSLTRRKDFQPTNDATAATSLLTAHMASFCRDESYRHLFEEDLQLFGTNLVHRERKHVPSHQETTQALTNIESSCRRAIEHFMLTRSFKSVTVQHLKDSTVELCRLLVAGEQSEEIREGLEVLSSHVKISATSFLLSCAAASIMQWLYLDFRPQLPDIAQSSLWNLLNFVLESKWLRVLSGDPSRLQLILRFCC